MTMPTREEFKKSIDDFFDDWECPSNKVYSEELAAHLRALVERRCVKELPKDIEHTEGCSIYLGYACDCGAKEINDLNAEWRRALNIKD